MFIVTIWFCGCVMKQVERTQVQINVFNNKFRYIYRGKGRCKVLKSRQEVKRSSKQDIRERNGATSGKQLEVEIKGKHSVKG